MTTTYYKATDGVFTIFRATQSRVYRGAWMTVDGLKTRPTNFGFSAKAGGASGVLPAVEITQAEYQALVTLKSQRTKDHSPSASWVRNADLGVAQPAPEVFEEAEPPRLLADPTKVTYLNLVQAYDYLNAELWGGRLPTCLVTLQRKANCRGYFAGGRFVTRDNQTFADEIALNPSTFKERDTRCILSTLAHEMAHLDQHHNGKPGKGGYHNEGWVEIMLRIGLKPVSIDKPGKMTGNKVTHEIVKDGPFDVACAALVINQRVLIDYVEAWSDEGKAKAAKKLKVKYSCPECGTNCWAKPGAHFVCGDCDEAMEEA